MNLKQNTSLKSSFTSIFLKSLAKIKRGNRFGLRGPASEQEIHKRSQRIKIAAYSSMAYAVGSKRAWSRALLSKLRSRARTNRSLRNKRRVIKRKVSRDMDKVDLLRKLVPGGKTMEICGLLGETAHYIKCLSTQVKVMQSIVDQCPK